MCGNFFPIFQQVNSQEPEISYLVGQPMKLKVTFEVRFGFNQTVIIHLTSLLDVYLEGWSEV